MAQQIIGSGRLSQRTAGSTINSNFTELYAAINSNLATVATKTSDYTVVLSDSSVVIRMNSSSNLNLNLPNNMPVGFQVVIVQSGTGQVTLVPASGAVINSRGNISKTAGQHAMLSLLVTFNTTGTSANYNVTGDGV